MDIISIVVGVVLGYLVLMFILHEMFKKFFHTILFVSFVALALALLYLFIRGI
ncbi:MAG: hypothetical protein AABX00_00530 [Nanoarchaeota archaeon]